MGRNETPVDFPTIARLSRNNTDWMYMLCKHWLKFYKGSRYLSKWHLQFGIRFVLFLNVGRHCSFENRHAFLVHY
jgi:hypothetical protein